MCLRPSTIQPVPQPQMTALVARTAFPRGNPYIQIRDVLGTIYHDEDFSDLYPGDGQPAIPPWHLALVTVVQFIENLTDRQAADAVRSRIERIAARKAVIEP